MPPQAHPLRLIICFIKIWWLFFCPAILVSKFGWDTSLLRVEKFNVAIPLSNSTNLRVVPLMAVGEVVVAVASFCLKQIRVMIFL